MVAFDREGDLLSTVEILPRGVIATRTNCPTGYDILNKGLQVVYDLSTWEDDDQAAGMIATVVNQLMTWAESRPSHERVPCLIVLDEAAHWLPERRGDYMSIDSFKSMRDTFRTISSIGRKRGLTPLYACPKISELSKSVMLPGMYVFMKATLDTDLKRYLEYIHSTDLTAKQLKTRIAAFSKGKAIVSLPTGSQKLVTFHTRKSEHTSHTPGVQAAINRYSSLPFDPEGHYGMYLEPSEMQQPVTSPVVEPVKPVSTIGPKPPASEIAAKKAKLRRMLKADPTLAGTAIAQALDIHPQTACAWKREILKRQGV